MTITGTGSKAEYADILQQVVYDNALDAPTIAPNPVRTISVAVSDGTENSNTAFSALTVEHGCPCSSFTNDSIVTTGLIELFAPTDGTGFPASGTDWGWTNASCDVTETLSTDSLVMHFNLLVDGGDTRVWIFRSDTSTLARNCLSTVDPGGGQGLRWFQRKGEGTPISRPDEEITDYTAEMDTACRARIPIQIERLRATFHAAGDPNGASNCAPIP